MRSLFILPLLFIASFLFSQSKAGLNYQKKGSMPGYVLFAPLFSKNTYLIDKCGKEVHAWKSNYTPGQSVYLLPNGELLRAQNDSNQTFKGGGKIERFDWNSKLLWSYKISNTKECQHHDICPLPNGNILVLVWELKTREEALQAGRKPELLKDALWSEKIIEIKPVGKNGAKIVWEWHAWDHLVQQHDSLKINYGSLAQNRQLINLNFSRTNEADFLHFNSIAYNPSLDQVLVSNRNYSEIFILDHSTSTAEASGHKGGKHNKGGDLLYRYGNAKVYGGEEAQILFGQHQPNWIEKGLKDEGKIILFNNGMGRRENNYSSIEIITPPLDEKGSYGALENTIISQFYSEKQNEDLGGTFFSPNVSGAQRLPNGNTLVCSGSTGQFCELDENKKIVWLYINPITIRGKAQRKTVALVNQVFRCTFYEENFKGFKGKSLVAGAPHDTGDVRYECMTIEDKDLENGK